MKRIFFLILLILSTITRASEPSAELLDLNTNVILSNGTLRTTYSYQIKINDRDGQIHGKIRIPFSKIYKLSNVSARILDSDGSEVRKIKSSEMTDRSAISSISFYEDDFIREFTARHNVFPYIIQYSYTITCKQFMRISSWVPVLDLDIPTKHAQLKVRLVDNININYLARGVPEATLKQEGKTRVYKWETNYDGAIEYENYAPSYMDLIPGIEIMPDEFNFETTGSNRSWVDFGNWIIDLNKGLNDLSEKDKRSILSAIKGLTSDYEKIKVLYNKVQDETRYVNISIETGGLKPYPASYVSEKKYGDCKALTNYFKSILEIAGIESFYALVLSGDEIEQIHKELPGQQFDHVILMVPVDSDTLWLDCTSKGPFNQPGTFIQNRDAFIIARNRSHFASIPPLPDHQLVQERIGEFSLHPDSKVEGTITSTYRGSDFNEVYHYHSNTASDLKEYVLRNYFVAEGFSPKDFNIVLPHRDSAFIVVEARIESLNFIKSYGNQILMNIVEMDLPFFEKPEYRKLPVHLDFPIILRDSFNYKVPDACKLSLLPEPVDIVSKFGYYNSTYIIKEEIITEVKNLKISRQHIGLEEYNNFYEFIKKIRLNENKNRIVFETQ